MVADGRQGSGVAGLEQPRVLAQVLPHAEGPAGTGQHDRADGGVVVHLLQHVAQGQLHRDREGVHPLGPVEHDGRDGPLQVQLDEVV